MLADQVNNWMKLSWELVRRKLSFRNMEIFDCYLEGKLRVIFSNFFQQEVSGVYSTPSGLVEV